mmetsp:Transcript_23963/g.66616  ORF Transcript_23963/g.66616 Transcript_23963/m.66616 type:complete len:324 (-) Transcript_23963:15-986(-)
MRAWFQLDPQGVMKIGEQQFVRGCKDIGFRGNAAAVWHYMDHDRSGSITILELHAPSASLLASFKQFCEQRGGVRITFELLDDNNSGRVRKRDFVQKFRAFSFDGNKAKLFELLDRSHKGWVTLQDIGFLEKWQPPLYINLEPNFQGFCRLKEILGAKQKGNHLATWRQVLDRDGIMRMSWSDWRMVCAKLARAGTVSATDTEVATFWRAMDSGCRGRISLRDWDHKAFQVLSEFKHWAVLNHGSVVQAFRALDGSSNCKLSLLELKKAARGPGGVKGDLEMMFDGLDVHSAWVLTEAEVKFLDDWDVAWESWEIEAITRCGD